MSIEIGLKGRAEVLVTQANTASAVGSGAVPVFGTPFMIALMEQAASDSMAPYLEPGQGSVGVHISTSHLAATPIGMKVWAESVVTAVDRKKITFEVHAYDEQGEIGAGTHERFIIDQEKFLAKVQSKMED